MTAITVVAERTYSVTLTSSWISDTVNLCKNRARVAVVVSKKFCPNLSSLKEIDSEVHVFEVDLQYPTTSAVLTELLADQLQISPAKIRVRTPGEMAEMALNLEHNQASDESFLLKDYADENNQDLVGQKHVVNFLKELGKQEHTLQPVAGVNDQLLAKTVPTELAGKTADVKPGISPVGSRQNKIPDPYKGK